MAAHQAGVRLALRRERRAAAVKLHKAKPYTVRTTGEVLELLGNCVIVRPDGVLVVVSWSLDAPTGDSVVPVFTVHRSIGRGWRVRLARWLINLR